LVKEGEVKKRKSVMMENLELRRGRGLEEMIEEQFARGLSKEEVARELGINYWTFRSWLDRLGARLETTVRFESEERS
jgi:DNA-directed RNA polymerase specialized sigma24 family protein